MIKYNFFLTFFSPPFCAILPRPVAEIGDYDPNKHSFGYVSEFRIVPNQTKELESRIVDIHKQIKGIGPAQAEFNFLDKVKWLDMYGVDLHPVLVSAALITLTIFFDICMIHVRIVREIVLKD